PGPESMPPDERCDLQEHRLRELIDRLLAAGGLQGRRLTDAGVGGGADVGLADLARLPCTSKQDLWEHYPFGMLAVPRSEVVAVIADLRPDVLTCTPSYAVRLGEALAEAGLRPGDGLALRAGLFGAEPWTGELRRRICALLGLRALDIYGLSEVIGPGVAAEC